MTNIVVNELLCYVQNNVSAYPRLLVGVAVVGFYLDEEVANAKSILHSIIESKQLDDIPRLRKRQGDNKRKLDCDDILELFMFADSHGCQLPTFVVANLKRVPSVVPGEVDVYALASSLAALTSHVGELEKRMQGLAEDNAVAVKKIDDCISLVGNPSVVSCPIDSGNSDKDVATSQANSWAGVASTLPITQPPLKRSPAPIRLKGTGIELRVKAVPRPPVRNLLKAFVGRIDINTTEEDLTELLREKGLDVVHCRRLKPPGDKVFSTAAFYVACAEDCHDLFYNEATWPTGTELRDWYTKS